MGPSQLSGETQRNAKEKGWGELPCVRLQPLLTETEDKRLIYEPHRISLRITGRTCKEGPIEILSSAVSRELG